MQTAYITHPECQLHDMGRYHPESPERLRAIEDQLIASGLLGLLSEHEAPAASREQLIRVHDAAYVDEIEAAAPDSGIVHLDPDTAMNAHSYRAALHAAGAAILAADLVIGEKVANAFCSVRPPGHHAMVSDMNGFCLFNNGVITAKTAIEKYNLQR